MNTNTRYAIVRSTSSAARQVAAYLPDNYSVIGLTADGKAVIAGHDVCGWTLDDYVIPRLASGLHFADEIEEGPELVAYADGTALDPVEDPYTRVRPGI